MGKKDEEERTRISLTALQAEHTLLVLVRNILEGHLGGWRLPVQKGLHVVCAQFRYFMLTGFIQNNTMRVQVRVQTA